MTGDYGCETYHSRGLAQHPDQSLLGDNMRTRVEEVGESDMEETERSQDGAGRDEGHGSGDGSRTNSRERGSTTGGHIYGGCRDYYLGPVVVSQSRTVDGV